MFCHATPGLVMLLPLPCADWLGAQTASQPVKRSRGHVGQCSMEQALSRQWPVSCPFRPGVSIWTVQVPPEEVVPPLHLSFLEPVPLMQSDTDATLRIPLSRGSNLSGGDRPGLKTPALA